MLDVTTDTAYDDSFCEHCRVVPITPGDKYCAECTEDICTFLAEHYDLVLSYTVENGWY